MGSPPDEVPFRLAVTVTVAATIVGPGWQPIATRAYRTHNLQVGELVGKSFRGRLGFVGLINPPLAGSIDGWVPPSSMQPPILILGLPHGGFDQPIVPGGHFRDGCQRVVHRRVENLLGDHLEMKKLARTPHVQHADRCAIGQGKNGNRLVARRGPLEKLDPAPLLATMMIPQQREAFPPLNHSLSLVAAPLGGQYELPSGSAKTQQEPMQERIVERPAQL